jgi:N6-adenosine-specific RNA methylase IME4
MTFAVNMENPEEIGAPEPFSVIALDPPWAERGGGKIKRGADRHYDLVPTSKLHDVITSAPVWRPADNALLWMWCTSSFLEVALELIPQLGFRRCCSFVWAKVDPVDDETFRPAARLGLGQWSRVEHEFLFLARRGAVKVPPASKRQRSVIYAPRGRHSAKPDEAWDLIEATSFSTLGEDARCLEMFARSARWGWQSWGDEAPDPSDDDMGPP